LEGKGKGMGKVKRGGTLGMTTTKAHEKEKNIRLTDFLD
jgi:hypothetical protein